MDLGDFTVEAWFKALSASGTWFRIFDFGKGGPGDFFITPNHGRTGNDIGGGCHFSGGHVDFGHYPTVKEKFPLKMIAPQPMTGTIRLILVAILILVGSRLEAKPAELVFTYWGPPFERRTVEKVVQKFNQQHANIRVRPQHIPGPMISKWISAGWLMDLSGHFQNDPAASNRMSQIYYKVQDKVF